MWRWRREHGSFQPSVRMPRIAAAVLPLQLLKSVQPENVLGSARLLQSGDEPVSLRIQIRADVMRHLAGRVTQTDPLVKRNRAKPHFPPVVKPIPVPEPNVVPLSWAVANRLLEGKVLFAAEQFEGANGRVFIRPPKDRINCDANAAAKCQRISGIPLRRDHSVNHVCIRTKQGNVHRVAGNPIGRVRDARCVEQLRMTTDVPFPGKRHYYVCDRQVEQYNRSRQLEQTTPAAWLARGLVRCLQNRTFTGAAPQIASSIASFAPMLKQENTKKLKQYVQAQNPRTRR